MASDDPKLAAFQSAILEALHRHEHAPAILSEIRAHPAAEPFLDSVDKLEPRMVEGRSCRRIDKEMGPARKMTKPDFRKQRKRDLHFLNDDGMVACNPRDKEAAHRAEVEGIATDDPSAVTCKNCIVILSRAGRLGES